MRSQIIENPKSIATSVGKVAITSSTNFLALISGFFTKKVRLANSEDSLGLNILHHQIIGQAPTPTPQEKMTIVGWASEPVLAIASKRSIIQYQSRTDGFFKITKLDVGIVAFDEEVCRFGFEPLVVKAQEGREGEVDSPSLGFNYYGLAPLGASKPAFWAVAASLKQISGLTSL